MLHLNERQAVNLQMVEIDHNVFAVEVKDGNVRINLTSMAKSFGSNIRLNDWLSLKSTQEYLDVLNVYLSDNNIETGIPASIDLQAVMRDAGLSSLQSINKTVTGIPVTADLQAVTRDVGLSYCQSSNNPVVEIPASTDLLTVIKGGIKELQGTWANHHLVALEFARWLSPKFAILTNRLVLNLLAGEFVAVKPIGGVMPIIHNGKVGYPRKEIFEAAGYSPRSGTGWRLKQRYPEDFFSIYRVACVSEGFAKLRMERGRVRQLALDFCSVKPLIK